MNQKDQMLKDIGILSFTLLDLGLFLDTHPMDRTALDYFNHYSRIYQQLVKEFSLKYYPLCMNMSDCSKEWKWGAAPLPWEGVCG